MASQPKSDLPLWLWLGLPVLLFLFILAVIIFSPGHIDTIIEKENGVVELGTSIVLLPGIFAGTFCFLQRRLLPVTWLGYWLLLVTLGCVYIAGEEISWGQQLLSWDTPEYLQQINDQQETNVHNISSWFDQKPRLILELSILIGGIVLVLWRKFKAITYASHDWRSWFWPGMVCFPAALVAITIRFPERYESITGEWPLPVFVRFSEVQEFYFGIFLSLYLLSCYFKLKALHDRPYVSG